MNSPQSGLAGVPSGVLGARPPRAQPFHGSDPDLVASTAICQVTPTKCQARTRLYRHGRLELEGFPVAEISDHLVDAAVTVWLDLRGPDPSDLGVLSGEIRPDPPARGEALPEHPPPKLHPCQNHPVLERY